MGFNHSAAVGAARLQFAEGLLNQIKQMPEADQMQVMRDLIPVPTLPSALWILQCHQASFLVRVSKVDETGHCCSHTDWL